MSHEDILSSKLNPPMLQPLVSIVIPAHNAEAYIQETIQSALNQTFQDFEIIVVNDASQDRTLEILQHLQDPRINIFNATRNGGVSKARNQGITLAKGKLIALLDADDLWSADKLADQVQALQSDEQVGLVYSWTYYMEDQTGLMHCIKPQVQGQVYKTLLTQNFIGSIGSNILVRKAAIDAIGGFDEELTYAEDWEFCLRLAKDWAFKVIPKAQVYYRQHATSSLSNFQKIEQSLPQTIEKLFQDAPAEYQPYKARVYSLCYQHLADLYTNRDAQKNHLNSAFSTIKKMIYWYPLSVFDKRTLIVLIKLFLILLFPYSFAKKTLAFLSKTSATRHAPSAIAAKN